MNKIILTDVDEVLCTWRKSFGNWVKNFKGIAPVLEGEVHYSLTEWLGISRQLSNQLTIEFNNSVHLEDLPAYKDALNYVPKLVDDGYKFVAITSCSELPEAWKFRKNNLDKLFGKDTFLELHCIELSGDKKPLLEKYSPTFWIEDKPENAIKGLECGHKSILITKPYNLKFNHPDIVRVDGWGEIYNLIHHHTSSEQF